MIQNHFISTLLLSLAVQVVFFIYAAWKRTDTVTDLSYGLTFIILAIYSLIVHQTFLPYQIVAAGLITLWGIRLATYLFIRINTMKRDKRFDGIREKFWSFASFWFFQAIAVWVISIPATYLHLLSIETPFGIVMVLGVMVWAAGMIIETIADVQKFTFKNNPANKGKWIMTGIWKYARHPNYFGEMTCWWGIFILSIPLQSGLSWITIIGPITITYILLFATGIPTLEKKYNEIYKDNEEYQKYKRSTNLLIPFPRV